MAGTVFLSCGQNDRELAIAEHVAVMLREPPFGLTVFIARSTNNLLSLNNDVLSKLSYADYVIFVNFCRAGEDFPGSLYAHQELAMTLAVGHRQLLIYSEVGAPTTGLVSFVVQNRPAFKNTAELLEQVRADVTQEQWNPHYSRFLCATELQVRRGISFSDGAGNFLAGTAIGAVIHNGSRDLQETVMITLEKLDGKAPEYHFRSPLKVSGQRRYDAAIPPEASVIFDTFMDGTRTSAPLKSDGVFLVSALDLAPLPPLIADKEDHVTQFRIDARGRPPIRFTVKHHNGTYTLA